MWDIGKAIKTLRENKELTQKEIADYIGTTARNIGYYENGDRKVPSEYIPKFCEVLGVTTEYLLTGRQEIETNKGLMKIKFKSGNAAAIKSDLMQDLIKKLEENKIDAEALISELVKSDN